MNETLRTIDGRHVLRIERRLAHPPRKVWRALTESTHLRAWFPADIVGLELVVGAPLRFVFREGEAEPSAGVVTEVDPPRVLAYRWEGELLRWELQPDGAGCLLLFTHTFDDRPAAASFASGWKTCLDALERELDGRPGEAPPFDDTVHEGYVARFGLNQGTVETTADGWRIRFERQTTRPLPRVWAALVGAREPAVGAPAPEAAAPAGYAGAVTTITPPTRLECAWRRDERDLGRLCWELSPGPGGARLVVTHTGPRELADAQPAALATWQAHLEALVRRLLEEPR